MPATLRVVDPAMCCSAGRVALVPWSDPEAQTHLGLVGLATPRTFSEMSP
jgi:hypothetical protein